MQQLYSGFPRLIALLTFLIFCLGTVQAQQPQKGLPPDLPQAELLIICYNPENFVTQEPKAESEASQKTEQQEKACAEANKRLAIAAKYAYPFSYRLISRKQLSQLQLTNSYIFDPAGISGSADGSTIPLLLRHAASGKVYQVGQVARRNLTSAGEIMEAFLKPIHKQYPIHSLGDYDGDWTVSFLGKKATSSLPSFL